MTPVGHSLTGIAVVALASSSDWKRKQWAIAVPAFVFLANAPDAPFPNWGHDRYDASHSLFVTGFFSALIFLFHAAAKRLIGGYPVSNRVATAACVAWFSHIFLDSLYGPGNGIVVTWPFGEGRLDLPVPWFETLGPFPIDWFSAHSAKVFAIEFVCYAPITVICLLLAVRRRYDLRL